MAYLYQKGKIWYIVDKSGAKARWIPLNKSVAISAAQAKQALARYKTDCTYLRLDMQAEIALTLRELCDDYIAELKAAKLVLASTINQRSRYLDRVCSEFGGVSIADLNPVRLSAWAAREKFKPNTVRLYWIALQAAYKLALSRRYLRVSPIAELKRPRVEVLPPKAVDPALIFAVLSRMNDAMRRRYLVLYYTGMRPSELLRLRVGDVDLAGCRIVLRKTKTKVFRVIPIHAEIADVLRDMMVKRKAGDFLVGCPKEGQGSLRMALRRAVVTSLADGVAGAELVTPYVFRHTFATQILDKTKNIRVVQQLLGHTDIKMTTRYATALDDVLADAVGTL